ncbi:hypothetical protein SRHO_G00108370 [Serrasalmus rhombeus]
MNGFMGEYLCYLAHFNRSCLRRLKWPLWYCCCYGLPYTGQLTMRQGEHWPAPQWSLLDQCYSEHWSSIAYPNFSTQSFLICVGPCPRVGTATGADYPVPALRAPLVSPPWAALVSVPRIVPRRAPVLAPHMALVPVLLVLCLDPVPAS